MQGKKSFVLYTDLIHSVNILTDEESGKLFKHILDYVNDKNPQLKDRIIQLTFEPIKQQLKRDLQKYQNRVVIAKTNGEKGGRPKKQIESQKTQSVKIKPKKAVNVNVNVNDIVNEVVIDNVIELPFNTKSFLNAWILWKQYKKEQFKYTFKSRISETTSLNKLLRLSLGDEKNALKILEQSVANGWKGFFQLTENREHKKNEPSNEYLESLKTRLNG